MTSRKTFPRSVFRDVQEIPYNAKAKYNLYKSVKGSEDWVQRLKLQHKLPIHTGCVNCICWNETGDKILSGSDDLNLIVTNPFDYKIITQYRTNHRANIFSAKFLPKTGDTRVISCSGDGAILHTDLVAPDETQDNVFNCHIGTTYEIATVPYDSNVFLSCGEDYTVRSFDLRVKNKCNKPKCTEDVIIYCQRAVTALTVNSAFPYQIAIGCADSTVRIYDRRMVEGPKSRLKPVDVYIGPGLEKKSFRITSLSYSPGGEDLLVSYSSEHLYLFGLKNDRETKYSTESSSGSAVGGGLGNWSDEEEDDDCDGLWSEDKDEAPPVRRLRLRGDWSDTGPDARPHTASTTASGGRPVVQGGLIQRMTDVLSRMLNDPATRAALTQGGDDTLREPEPPSLDATRFGEMGEEEGLEERLGDDGTSAGGDDDDSVNEIEETEEEADNLRTTGEEGLPGGGVGGGDLLFDVDDDEDEDDDEEMDVAVIEGPSGDTMDVISDGGESEVCDSIVYSGTEERGDEEETPICNGRQQSPIPHLQPQTANTESGYQEVGEPQPSTSAQNSNFSHLTNELSTMFDGFKEKYGKKPMVNLMYSAKGSTASTISMSVEQSTSQVNNNMEEEASSNPIQAEQPVVPPTIDEPDDNDEVRINEEEMPTVEGSTQCMFHATPRGQETQSDKGPSKWKRAKGEFLGGGYKRTIRLKKANVKNKYVGHRNARTMIKEATFWGNDYVMSGSDCGHVFIWRRDSGRLVMTLQADHHVVNCLQPHPYLPLLATSGIDYDVKLWAPLAEEPLFDPIAAEELTTRNAIMLEETKDTITVPASFMIRMLACLNQLRRGQVSFIILY